MPRRRWEDNIRTDLKEIYNHHEEEIEHCRIVVCNLLRNQDEKKGIECYK
jgi:hypothetical protein